MRTNAGSTALWLALTQLNSLRGESDRFSALLIERGATPDSVDSITGNSLLHQAALESNERAAIFLVCHNANVDHCNHQGETPMHVASSRGLPNLVQVLLQYGADPNLQTNLKVKKVMPLFIASLKLSETPPLSRGLPSLPNSPTSTLGVLSALSNMVASSPLLDGNHANSQHLMQLSSLSKASPLLSGTGLSGGASNPFGSDSDEDEIPRTSSGYHKSTPSVSSRSSTPQVNSKQQQQRFMLLERER